MKSVSRKNTGRKHWRIIRIRRSGSWNFCDPDWGAVPTSGSKGVQWMRCFVVGTATVMSGRLCVS